MRTLLLLGLVVGGLVVAGAIHISQSGDQVQISVDKQKVERVASEVLREGQAILKNAQSAPATQTR